MDILIVKLSALGDVLRTTALLPPLKRRHPRSRLAWLTAPRALPLLANNPHIDQVVTPSRFDPRPRFDLVLSLEEDPRSASLARRACRGAFVGVYAEGKSLRYTASSAPYYGMSLLRPEEKGGKAQADRLKAENRLTYAGLWASILGLEGRGHRPVLRLAPEELEAGRRVLRRIGLKKAPIGFNPGAGRRWPSKQLSEGAAARWASALARSGPVLLLGGPDEAGRNRRILAAVRRLPGPALVLDAGTGHPLRRFAAIVSACRALVTTDSLALHIGAALGVPTLAAVGPTSAAEQDIDPGRVVKAPCRCFYSTRCRLRRSCLDRLPESRLLGELAGIC